MGTQGPLYCLEMTFQIGLDSNGNVSVMGMASHEERPSFFCQQIFGKWEGFQLALTTLLAW